MADLAELTLRINSAQAERAADRMDRSLERLDISARSVAQSFRSLGIKMTAAVTAPLLLTGRAAVKAASEYETARISFGVFINDMERGAQVFDDIVQLAARTPLNVSSLQSASQILLATGAATADTLIPLLKNLGDVSRADSAIMQRLALNLGQVASQGRLTGRELRDFAVAGVPLIQVLADQLGRTTEQIRAMVSAGDISFSQVVKAFQAMSAEGGKFANLMERLSQTLRGKWTTAIDNVRLTLASMAELFRDQLKGILDAVIRTAQWFNSLSDEVKRLIVIASAMAAAIGPFLLIVGAIVALVPAIASGFALIVPLIIPIIAVLAKLTIALGAVILVVEGVRRAFGITWREIGRGLLDFGMKTVGFFANFRHNWGLLTDWLSRNWLNMLADFLYNFVQFGFNVVHNAGVTFGLVFNIIALTFRHVVINFQSIMEDIRDLALTWGVKIADAFWKIGEAASESFRQGLARLAFGNDLVDRLTGGTGQSRQSQRINEATASLRQKIEAAVANADFRALNENFRRTTEPWPDFITSIFGAAADGADRVSQMMPEPEEAGGQTRSSQLAEALEAGSSEALKLVQSQRESAEEKNMRKKNLKANEITAMAVRELATDGIQLKGVKEVQSIR